jgi:hypothetical protein
MAKKKPRSNTSKTTQTKKSRRKSRYTVGEWFMVLVGGLLVVLFAGIIITSILGD